jgi:NAD(P)-dependent dehydrogenase (short-subunit alcohol dehydrogenase family)
MRLAGRTALITGAAQGIGLAVAQRFAAEGAKLVLVDLNAEKVEAAAARLREGGAAASAVAADVTVAADVKAAVERALRDHGCLDVLVNNAGGSGNVRAFEIEAVTEEIWDRSMAVNLKSAFLFCREAMPHMKARGYGRIVNVSSGIARGNGRPQATAGAVLPYAAAKAGVLGLTSTLAKMVAEAGITVNAVVPGFVLTEPGARVRDWFDALDPGARAALLSRTSMGRPGEATEVANAILFLASEESSFVSGTALDVTGAA